MHCTNPSLRMLTRAQQELLGARKLTTFKTGFYARNKTQEGGGGGVMLL